MDQAIEWIKGLGWANSAGIATVIVAVIGYFGGDRLKEFLARLKAPAGGVNAAEAPDERAKFAALMDQVDTYARDVMKSQTAIDNALAIRKEFLAIPPSSTAAAVGPGVKP